MSWRRLIGLALSLSVTANTLAAAWALSQDPFTNQIIEVSAAEAKQRLDLALTRTVTDRWVTRELDEAIAANDPDRASTVLFLAERHQIVFAAQTRNDADALIAAAQPTLADCGRCAFDPGECPSLTQLAACNLLVELTPVGDVNALLRGYRDWQAGEEPDQLDIALGAAGLGATAFTLASGGTSYTVKFGATIVRIARRAGRITPEYMAVLRRAGRADIAALRAGQSTAELPRLYEPLATVAARTSVVDTLALLRVVKSEDEARLLARVADAQGPATRATVDALGPARAFRALTRLSDLALAAYATLALLAAQLGAIALWVLRRMLKRAGV